MTRIDAYAAEAHFLDHLLPVWSRLAPEERGTFYVAPSIHGHALARGIAELEALHVPPTFRALVPCDDPTIVAAYGDVKKARRMGRSRIALLQHGIGQSYAGDPRSAVHASYSGGADHDDVGLFVVPNRDSAARWAGRYPGARVVIAGSPKLDDIPRRGEGPGPTVAISFHWECRIVAETRSAALHYLRALPDLRQRYGRVLGHGHPRIIAGLMRHYKRAGIETVLDFDEVAARADVYVCDNSSSLYEFAATGRPVVVMNAPHYRPGVRHGLRFWDAADVGPQVWRPEDLAPAVDRALEERPEDVARREDALDLVFAYRSGGAERAADAVRTWARNGAELAEAVA